MSTPNDQLPTSKASRLQPLDESRDNISLCRVFQPEVADRASWELAVGSCELARREV